MPFECSEQARGCVYRLCTATTLCCFDAPLPYTRILLAYLYCNLVSLTKILNIDGLWPYDSKLCRRQECSAKDSVLQVVNQLHDETRRFWPVDCKLMLLSSSWFVKPVHSMHEKLYDPLISVLLSGMLHFHCNDI